MNRNLGSLVSNNNKRTIWYITKLGRLVEAIDLII